MQCGKQQLGDEHQAQVVPRGALARQQVALDGNFRRWHRFNLDIKSIIFCKKLSHSLDSVNSTLENLALRCKV
jgi:hypothetical protein